MPHLLLAHWLIVGGVMSCPHVPTHTYHKVHMLGIMFGTFSLFRGEQLSSAEYEVVTAKDKGPTVAYLERLEDGTYKANKYYCTRRLNDLQQKGADCFREVFSSHVCELVSNSVELVMRGFQRSPGGFTSLQNLNRVYIVLLNKIGGLTFYSDYYDDDDDDRSMDSASTPDEEEYERRWDERALIPKTTKEDYVYLALGVSALLLNTRMPFPVTKYGGQPDFADGDQIRIFS